MGVWKSGSGDRGRGSLQFPLFPDLENLYRNFQSRQLVTSAVDNWPFFELKSLENGTVVAVKGIDVTVISTLGNYLNFTWVT